MKQLFALLFLALPGISLFAQHRQPVSKEYRETAPRINDLVHTKIEVKPDFSKSHVYGKAWITLRPHFYATDTLSLDAKGMELHKVAIVKGSTQTPLKYDYTGEVLNIKLDKKYKSTETYTIFIDYTAKPDEYEEKYARDQMLGIKGFYFINPRGEEKDKPTQIWTQGETESSSAWFPTIDKPNQKTTQELSVTVNNKYVTLSNGKLVSQKKNSDGTRTDYWKMDLPHAPYLFFLGVGEYAIVKDTYKGKPVDYYVEPEYASVAKKIFGNTPEMMGFFSKITGVEYPWNKYSQITGRDYVAGAMENTTAVIHQETAQQDARQLLDGNSWESTIAHELFHHWFGDYVTTESWSNLTLNESFANYSEYLWEEYKNGRDAADEHNFSDMQGYLMSGSDKKDLVRFNYGDKEEMFDAVSYNKGGRILHMLRTHIGDSAFFKAINIYLTANKFKAAEAHQLRLAFEDVTGKDLNWFFNQWYFGSGHAKLDVNYSYDEAAKQVRVIVKQDTAKVFRLPVAIDVYHGANKTRHNVWAQRAVDTFLIAASTKPDLVNFDGDKVILGTRKENKTLEEYIHQYKYAGKYLDRREAIDAVAKKQDDPKALEVLKAAAKDKYSGLRSYAIGKLDLKKENVKKEMETVLVDIAKNDASRPVRASAINKLGDYKNPSYAALFKTAVNDSSYSVAGNALEALAKIDTAAAFNEAMRLANTKTKGKLQSAVNTSIIKYGDESSADFVIGNFEKMPLSQAKFEALGPMIEFLSKTNDAAKFKRGVDAIVDFKDEIPAAYQDQVAPYINGLLQGLAKKKAGNQELVDYIKGKTEEKKGF